MADLADIRKGLAAALSAIPGVQAEPYVLANPTPPTLHVLPSEWDYDRSMRRGTDWVVMVVQGYVAFVGDVAAQQRLDRMIAPTGPESVKALIEADPTLGGVADDLRVESCSGYRLIKLEQVGRGSVLGAEWRVGVLVSN